MEVKGLMSLPLISKYRTPLMGIAMLLVFFSHLPIPINNSVLNFFKWNGHFGVDIFVILSGMGLFFSFRKESNLSLFYTKRLLRIVPFYLFINLAYLLTPGFVPHYSLFGILATVTTIGYWFDYGYCDWFIPHLLLMYLLFPLLYNVMKRIDNRLTLFLIIAVWGVISLLPILDSLFYRAAFRWVIFTLGILLGKILFEDPCGSLNIKVSAYFSILSVGVGSILLIHFFVRFSDMSIGTSEQYLFQKGYIYMPYLLIVVGFSLLCGMLLEHYRDKKIGAILMGGGNLVGSMSLELYLVHIWFIPYAIYIFQQSTPSSLTLALLALFILSSFPVAYLLHLLNDIVTKRLKDKILVKHK